MLEPIELIAGPKPVTKPPFKNLCFALSDSAQPTLFAENFFGKEILQDLEKIWNECFLPEDASSQAYFRLWPDILQKTAQYSVQHIQTMLLALLLQSDARLHLYQETDMDVKEMHTIRLLFTRYPDDAETLGREGPQLIKNISTLLQKNPLGHESEKTNRATRAVVSGVRSQLKGEVIRLDIQNVLYRSAQSIKKNKGDNLDPHIRFFLSQIYREINPDDQNLNRKLVGAYSTEDLVAQIQAALRTTLNGKNLN